MASVIQVDIPTGYGDDQVVDRLFEQIYDLVKEIKLEHGGRIVEPRVRVGRLSTSL